MAPDELDLAATRPFLVDLDSGDVLGGKYEIESRIGRGGIGVVYKAWWREMGRAVAIKVLPEELSANPRAVAMMREEAGICLELTHEGIVRLYTYEREGELTYLVMEYVRGITLEQYLGLWGKLGEEETVRVGRAVCEALSYAHGRRVVHRDLKPANILLANEVVDQGTYAGVYEEHGVGGGGLDLGAYRVKVADFGIARQIKDTMSLVSRRATSGTLLYMSPEQHEGLGLDARSDVYSLGVTLYELLSGNPPFHTGNIVHQVLHTAPRGLEGVSDRVNRVLMKALGKKPEERWESAEEFSRALACEIGVTDEARVRALVVEACEAFTGGRYEEVVGKRRDRLEQGAGEPDAGEAEQDRHAAGSVVKSPLRIEMVRMPAGILMMGSPSDEPGRFDDEGPQRRVTISRAFWMGKYEVTQGQWEGVMGENPSHFKNWGSNCPVESVSWLDAVAFCNKLSEREGLRPAYPISGESVSWDRGANGYRLPTEAEWEYAARAGTDTLYHSGNTEADLSRVGWYTGNSGRKTHAVGQKAANAWGLNDMHGNVWEWCWDWFGSYSSGAVTDPAEPGSGLSRVCRGGSWINYAHYCRSANRFNFAPGFRDFNLSFRLARSAE